ncbi:MAG: hypothetical protein AAF551_00115 [Bacteroidota bacterium]
MERKRYRNIGAFLLVLGVVFVSYSQKNDDQFQVLVAKNAKALGSELLPLDYVDDITSIEIDENGFVALVHRGGTTFELKETTFSFYLKPDKFKSRDTWPQLATLYEDSARTDQTNLIRVLHPHFDRSGLIKVRKGEPIDVYWHLVGQPVISYKVSISDHNGKKIQDFGSSDTNFVLKPFNYGLEEESFMLQVSSSIAGETITSKRYTINLEEAPSYPMKAADLVIKALDLELEPEAAIGVWKEIFGKENGKYYLHLFEKFVNRNRSMLLSTGEDLDLMISKNKSED